MKDRPSIRTYLLVSYVGLISAMAASWVAMAYQWARERTRSELRNTLAQTRTLLEQVRIQTSDKAHVQLRSMAAEPMYRALIGIEDKATLTSSAEGAMATFALPCFGFLSSTGEVLAWAGAGVNQLREAIPALLHRADAKRTIIENDEVVELSIAPVLLNGRVAGYLVAGYRVDAALLSAYAKIVRSPVRFVFNDRALAVSQGDVGPNDATARVSVGRGAYVAYINEDRIARPMRDLLGRMTLIGALILLVGYLLIAVFVRSFTGPILQLAELAKRVARGALEVRSQETGAKELRVLGRSFNRMVSALEQSREERRSYSERLESTVRERTREAEEARARAEAATRAKSDFLAMMSHEIRTPMNAMLGLTELLSLTKLDITQQRYAQTALGSAKLLLTIINDVLDFSRIEAGRLELHESVFDLRQLTEEIAVSLAHHAHKKNIELNCQVKRDLKLHGDADRLRQVLTNLTNNAIKFTDSGEVSIFVDAIEVLESEAAIRVEVMDTGIGLSTEDQSRVFSAFIQAGDPDRSRGGTGLGLAICKQLIGLMGGELGVTSTPSKGSTFWFELRLKREIAPVALSLSDSSKIGPILTVEPNDTNRAILSAALGHLDISHIEVASANEAIAKLEEAAQASDQRIRTVLLNLSVPGGAVDPGVEGGSGVALAKEISARTEFGRPRILLMTPTGANLDASRYASIDRLIPKPICLGELYEAIGERKDVPTPRLPSLSEREPQARFVGRIMIAEDNPVNQMVVKSMLARLGIPMEAIHTVVDGRAAIEAHQSARYALILMDGQMPRLDGYKATGAIREAERADPTLGYTTIIGLTANAMENDRKRALDAGMDDYLTKPLRIATLTATLDRWLFHRDKSDPEQPADSANSSAASIHQLFG